MARKVKGPSFDPNLLLAKTGRGRSKLEYRSEEVVFSQGDAANSIFYILRGKIKIVVISKQGREAVIALLSEGDFFGEGCLIAQPLRLATAASMTDATVMRVEKAEMLRLLHAEPDFAEVFTVHLLTRNSRVEADLADHLFNSSEKRLARALLLLANFGKEGTPEPITDRSLEFKNVVAGEKYDGVRRIDTLDRLAQVVRLRIGEKTEHRLLRVRRSIAVGRFHRPRRQCDSPFRRAARSLATGTDAAQGDQLSEVRVNDHNPCSLPS